MNYSNHFRRHNDLGPRSPRSQTQTPRLSPTSEGDIQISLAYAQGLADSNSFWFTFVMFLSGLAWGSLLTWWFW